MILCIQKDFHSGILKLFEENFGNSISFTFRLTEENIRTVIILFSVYFPSIHAPESSSDERLWYL